MTIPDPATDWAERAEREDGLLRQARARRVPVLPAPVSMGSEAGCGEMRLLASSAQRRIYFLHHLEPAERSYRISMALLLRGHLDPAAMEAALQLVVSRHTSLRTVLRMHEGKLWQVVLPMRSVSALRYIDGARPLGEPLDALIDRLVSPPFDLSTGPLFRPTLCRLGPVEHLLLCELHHAIADAWSVGVLCDDLALAYKGGQTREPGEVVAAPPLTPIVAETAECLDYWRDRLAGAPLVLSLPTDRVRGSERRHRGERLTRLLPPSVSAALANFASRTNSTLAAVVLAAYSTVLHRWSGDSELVIGTPFAGRPTLAEQRTIGLFARTLPIRIDFGDDPPFDEVVRRVQVELLTTLSHQDLAFEELVTALDIAGNTERNPVFQVLFAMQNFPPAVPEFLGLQTEPLAVRTAGAKLDLALHATPDRDGLHLALEYDADLFEPATVNVLIDQLEYALSTWTAPSRQPVGDLCLASAATRDMIASVWAVGPVRPAPVASVVDLVAKRAANQPEAVALRQGLAEFSYGQLTSRVDSLAARISARITFPERLVAVLLPRSFELLAALLAVHRAGAAYVPLEPHWPAARLTAILRDCRPDLLLTTRALGDSLTDLDGTPVLTVDQEDGDGNSGNSVVEVEATVHSWRAQDPAELAYIVYTSGSTGVPKGVMVHHGGLNNHVNWAVDALGLADGRGALLHSSVGFDLPVPVLFAPLVDGRTLTLADNSVPDAIAGAEEMKRGEYSFLKLTPSHLRALAAEVGWHVLSRTTRILLIAGEELRGEALRELAAVDPEHCVLNEYGPTEITVACTAFPGQAADFAALPRVPVGHPLPNNRVYLLDRCLRPVPPGVLGEVYIGGSGVARGYRGRPGATAEKFGPDPFSQNPGARMYRSGDLGRLRPDGALVFAQRADLQVKVRGVRVELSEIEEVLRSHPAVLNAAVVALKYPETRLRAFVVASDEPSLLELVGWLRGQLPDQLVPTEVVRLAALPLTGNGKLDRAALLSHPSQPAFVAQLAPAPADLATPTELAMADIWAQILGIPRPSAKDHFFALGGHSLGAVELVDAIHESFGVDCSLSAIFRSPGLRDIATLVEELILARVANLSSAEVETMLMKGERDGADS